MINCGLHDCGLARDCGLWVWLLMCMWFRMCLLVAWVHARGRVRGPLRCSYTRPCPSFPPPYRSAPSWRACLQPSTACASSRGRRRRCSRHTQPTCPLPPPASNAAVSPPPAPWRCLRSGHCLCRRRRPRCTVGSLPLAPWWTRQRRRRRRGPHSLLDPVLPSSRPCPVPPRVLVPPQRRYVAPGRLAAR